MAQEAVDVGRKSMLGKMHVYDRKNNKVSRREAVKALEWGPPPARGPGPGPPSKALSEPPSHRAPRCRGLPLLWNIRSPRGLRSLGAKRRLKLLGVVSSCACPRAPSTHSLCQRHPVGCPHTCSGHHPRARPMRRCLRSPPSPPSAGRASTHSGRPGRSNSNSRPTSHCRKFQVETVSRVSRHSLSFPYRAQFRQLCHLASAPASPLPPSLAMQLRTVPRPRSRANEERPKFGAEAVSNFEKRTP
mmetsp:Transcript_28871/g.43729  ORF Transcript_28871/g.43729 Transcript_28871/m.43729 type:complete len:245 (-) Transcript_28871:294-1028(-)